MLIQLLRSTMIAGEPVPSGSTIDIDPTAATMLVGIGKAILAPTPEPPAPAEPAAPPEATPAKPTRRSSR